MLDTAKKINSTLAETSMKLLILEHWFSVFQCSFLSVRACKLLFHVHEIQYHDFMAMLDITRYFFKEHVQEIL